MFTLFFGGNDFAPNFRVNRRYSRIYADDGSIDTTVLDEPTGPSRSPTRSLRFSKSGSFSPAKLGVGSSSPTKKPKGDRGMSCSLDEQQPLGADAIEIKISDGAGKGNAAGNKGSAGAGAGPGVPQTGASLHSNVSNADMPYYFADSAASPCIMFTDKNFCSVQDFLQDHFVMAMRVVARALKK